MTTASLDKAWVDSILRAIRRVTGEGQVPLHAPEFSSKEWKYTRDCLDSTFVSSVGAYVDRFEKDLAAYTGAAHAVAVVNGTAALHVALLLAGVVPGDEVLVPALTFVATANAVHYCHAFPHFVDSCPVTLGLDPVALARWLEQTAEIKDGICKNKFSGRRLAAVVPMHAFGHPCDMDRLGQLAARWGIPVVEDAAESLGSLYKERQTGTFGKLGTLSFNGNKIITTGGGGAILTNDPELGRLAKHLTTTAKIPHRWEYVHDRAGFNYRLPNINAALGCAQLEQLDRFIRRKRDLFELYRTSFNGVSGVSLVGEPEGCRSNYWLQTILLDKGREYLRDPLLKACNDAGMMARPAWQLLPRLEPYKNCPGSPLPVAESLEARLINIPSSPALVRD